MNQAVIEPLPPNAQELLTVDQFAKLLKVSRTTVFSWLKTGVLLEGVHYIRLGKILRFRWVTDLLFRKMPKIISRPKPKKQPTSPGLQKSSLVSSVNLEYGLLNA